MFLRVEDCNTEVRFTPTGIICTNYGMFSNHFKYFYVLLEKSPHLSLLCVFPIIHHSGDMNV